MNTNIIGKILRVLFILVFMLGTVWLPSISVKSQETTGSISGTVQDKQGNVIVNAQVCATYYQGRLFRWLWWWSCTLSGANGGYTISDLPVGFQLVKVHADGWANEIFNNTYSWRMAIPVTVKASETTTGIDFALEPSGSISGAVRDDQLNSISGAAVCATYDDVSYLDANPLVDCATSGVDGSYTITSLVGGNYRVTAQAYGMAYELFNNVSAWNSATPVAVIASETTTGIDFSLVPAGFISGTVQDYQGMPISNAEVCAGEYELTGTGHGVVRCEYSDSSGYYSIGGLPGAIVDLPGGVYRVGVEIRDKVSPVWFENTYFADSATPVTVYGGQTTREIDFVLGPWGSISGYVYESDGVTPIPNMGVTCEEPWHAPDTYTDEIGHYIFNNVPFGLEWRCSAALSQSGDWDYLIEYWQEVEHYDQATGLTLSNEVPAYENINFTLEKAGTISGIVQDMAGNPIPNARVCAREYDTGTWGDCSPTDIDGSYILERLHADDYRASAVADGWQPEFFDNVPVKVAAKRVRVTAGEDMPGVNFTLALAYHIEVNPVSQWIRGRGWPLDTEIELTVTDQSNNETLHEWATMGPAPWNPGNPEDIVADFYWPDSFDLNPGDTITMVGGDITRSMTVSVLQVTDFDPNSNTVTGIGDEGYVHVWPKDGSHLWIMVDSNGDWTANFTPFDLTPGTDGGAQQFDENGNYIQIDWRVPNPYIEASAMGNWVQAREWPINTVLALTINGADGDYTTTATMEQAPWNPGDPNDIVAVFDLQGYDIRPGDTLTVIGGMVTKVLQVGSVTVTSIDSAAGTVSGNADPNAQLHVWVCDNTHCANRNPTAGDSGTWTANFLELEPNGDGSTFILVPGTNGGVQQYDNDADMTQADWNVPFPIWEAPDSIPLVIGITENEVTETILDPCFEPPYRVMADGTLSPAGAVAYSVSPDGLLYTITFREMNWSDGEPVTAQHYADGLFHLLTPAIESDVSIFYPIVGAEEYKKGLITDPDLVGIQPLNDQTLQITLDQPIAYFPQLLAFPAFRPVRLDLITQYGDGWMAPENFVGNGPYLLIEQDEYHLILEKNPSYYNKDKVQFNQIGFPIFYGPINDVEERLNAYSSGDVDALWLWPRYEYKTILDDPMLSQDIDISYLPGLQYLGFNTQRYPTNNPLVRKALASAIDRDYLINTIIGAPWHREATGVIPPELIGYQGDAVGYAYDSLQAQNYLAQAGFPGGVGFPGIKLISNTGHEDIVEYIAQQWQIVLGIPVQVEYLDWAEYWGMLQDCHDNPADCDYNVYRSGWIIDYTDPYNILGDLFKPESMAQATGWNNPGYLELLGFIQTEMNAAQRLEYVHEAEQILVGDDAVAIPLYFTDRMSLVRPGIIPYFGLMPQLHLWGNSDIDGDGQQDLLDPCPADATDACNQQGSASSAIGPEGGTLTTENGYVSVQVPSGALAEYISLSITDGGSRYLINTDQGQIEVVVAVDIEPSGTIFTSPITVTFTWQDSDNDGKVDGTNLKESRLVISKDGIVIAGPCITDANCNMASNTFTVQVSSLSFFVLGAPPNQPPVISQITAPLNPVQLGQSINATLTFSDPDVIDTHTITWEWGDGSTTTLPATVPSVTTAYTYTATGVYTLKATITDAASESTSATFQYVVIYDPIGGFVTGGGWITSPLGAYALDPTLTGKATFGFVSKYQNGASVPTGKTDFRFHVANLNFESTSYDWLVIAGSKAQYKGTGTINATGNYGFMLTAIDGTPDKFRIKIWDKASGEVIYDNQVGLSDTADPVTALGGGSVVIHK